MPPPLTCSGVGEGMGEGLSQTVTSAKREVKEGDALLRFARSCKQTISSAPFLSQRKEKGGYKRELFCFGFASPCACTLFESCKAERNSSPHSLYNKVKNNLKRLFFTKGSQTRNGKFNQTKFSVFKMRV